MPTYLSTDPNAGSPITGGYLSTDPYEGGIIEEAPQHPGMLDTLRSRGSQTVDMLRQGDYGGALSFMGQGARESLIGGAKSLASSAYESNPATIGANLGEWLVKTLGLGPESRNLTSLMTGQPGQSQYAQDQSQFREALKPQGMGQEIGATAERMLEFMAPGGPTTKIPGMVFQAAKSGGTAAAQGGSAGDVALATGLGALGPAAGMAKTAASEYLAPRIINSLVKPVNKAFEFGKNPGRGVAKEGITANSLTQLGEKVSAKSAELGDLVDSILKPVKTKIDIRSAFDPVDDAIAAAVKDGDQALLARLRHFKDQLTYTFKETKPGKLTRDQAKPTSLTPFEANKVKREIGRQTKWREGDQYADDLNKLGIQVWRGISDMIEKAAPRVKSANSRWADIISAEKAIERRAVNEARRDLSGLSPILAGLGGYGQSAMSGDSPIESLGQGLMYGAATKGLGSTAVKTRAAAAAANPAAGTPLMDLIRAILLGSGATRQTSPTAQR